jgi:AbrB family looped-hinge helix DNA binding protein
MAIVRMSSKYQIGIPGSVRKKLGMRPGQKLSVIAEDGRILLVPVPDDPIDYLCGAAQGEPSMTEELLRDRSDDVEHE